MENKYIIHAGVKGMKWGVRRYQKKDGSLTPAGRKRYRNAKPEHDDYKKVHDKKSVKYMSDSELRERNNRLQMEQQYKSLTKKSSKGKKIVQTYIATAGLISGTVAATATYKKLANKALDKIGNAVVKTVDFSGPLTS